jgi:mycothiol synthase
MADLTTRTYRTGDAAGVAGLFNAIDAAFGGQPGFTTDEMHALVDAMIHDTDTDIRVVETPAGAIAAAGLVTTPPVDGFRVDLFGGVHPEWRGRGVGRDLLGWQLSRAVEIRESAGVTRPWEAEVGTMTGDESAVRLFRRFGFAPARYFFEMLAPAAASSAVALPAGLRSEPYRSEWESGLHAAHMEAFDDHWGYQRRDLDSWATFTVRSAGFRPDLSRVAFDGDEIAGYVLSYDHVSADRSYVGQVGTRRPWRGRGLASAVLSDVLAATGRAGKSFVSLGVDAESPTGAVGVYERVGFEVEYRTVAYRAPVR